MVSEINKLERNQNHGHAKPRTSWLPFCLFILGSVISFMLWQSLVSSEQVKIHVKTQQDLDAIQISFNTILDTTQKAQLRMFNRLEKFEFDDKNAWEWNANQYERDMPYFKAITWVNHRNHQQWDVISGAANPTEISGPMAQCLQFSVNNDGHHIHVLNLRHICFIHQSNLGALIAVADLKEFMISIVGDSYQPEYQLFLSLRSNLSELQQSQSPLLEKSWMQTLPLTQLNPELELVIWPTQNLYETNHTIYPDLFLITTLILTLSLAFSIHSVISSRNQARQLALEISERENAELRYQTIAMSARDGILVAKETGEILFCNQTAIIMFANSESDLINNNLHHFLSSDDTDIDSDPKWLPQLVGKTFELLGKHKEGKTFPVEVSTSRIHSPGICEITVIIRDITQRKQKDALIYHQANYDSLTNLPNRFLFEDRFKAALNLSDRTGLHTAVFLLDLDDFKEVNDEFGHTMGDELLKLVAGRLVSSFRASDTVARIGGDEFVALLTNIRHRDDIDRITDKIRENFSKPFVMGDHILPCGFSLGIAIYPADGKNIEELMKMADLAMYSAKRTGKNQIRYAGSGL